MATRYVWKKYRATTGTGLMSTSVGLTSEYPDGSCDYEIFRAGSTVVLNSDGTVTVQKIASTGASGGGGSPNGIDATYWSFMVPSYYWGSEVYEYTGSSTCYWNMKMTYADEDRDRYRYATGLSKSQYGTPDGSIKFTKWYAGTGPIKGSLVGNVYSTTSSSAYPTDGVHTDGYWYVYQGTEEYSTIFAGVSGTVKGATPVVCVSGTVKKNVRVYQGVNGVVKQS